MTTAILTAPARVVARPAVKTWTVPEFHQMGELGWFEGRRAMLIRGVILEDDAMNPPHAIAGTKTEDLIREYFGRGWHVRVQKPLVLGQTTDPEPDVAVVIGRPGDYTEHPTTAELIVEISDTSLRYDTTEKMSLYAAALIREYWVLDINGRQLLVHRDPVADATAIFGFRFASIQTFGAIDSVSSLAQPSATVRVADLLP